MELVAFERLVSLAREVGDGEARTVRRRRSACGGTIPSSSSPGSPGPRPLLRRLYELHASAVEDLALLQLDAGEVAPAVVRIQALVDREPFRERARAILMRALAEGGRPTEALRAFHSYRSLLREEIGTEPSGDLVDLDHAIRGFGRAVELVLARVRGGHPAWTRVRRSAPAVAHADGPPVPVSSFVGRRHDVATVLDLVGTHRLVTLTGSGGCGKTRLAIAVAAAEADRHGTSVSWVELGVVPASADVAEHVSAAVGLTPQRVGGPVQQLVDHVAGARPMLLVLDNAEHVLASVTGLLTELLSRCVSLRVLVTSREPLGIAGESVWRVPSLATPPPLVPVRAAELGEFDVRSSSSSGPARRAPAWCSTTRRAATSPRSASGWTGSRSHSSWRRRGPARCRSRRSRPGSAMLCGGSRRGAGRRSGTTPPCTHRSRGAST